MDLSLTTPALLFPAISLLSLSLAEIHISINALRVLIGDVV
jgi:hypothetical protein